VLEVNAPLAKEQRRYRGLTLPRLAEGLEHLVWRHADVVVAVSEVLARQIQDAGVDPTRVHVLPNAVEAADFSDDAGGNLVRHRLSLNSRFVVGFVGSFKQWHGVDLLLSAFQQVYRADGSAHLLLVGDGPLRERLSKEVARAGLEEVVTFADSVAHEEVPAYLAAMDVAVAPYPALVDFYYSPLKLFEYMAAGRAVVASRIGQIENVLRDEHTALLYEPGDATALASSVLRLRRDGALRQRLGRNIRAHVEEYTWAKNAARVTSCVESARSHRSVDERTLADPGG
jgi:glycosyltransferase involved in cell wall biosynthesis